MKIGILTFHRAYNYGAFLQCFSLQQNIRRSFPEATVEVIDYESQNMQNYYKTDILSLLFGHSSKVLPMTLRKRLSKAKGFFKNLKNDRGYVRKIKRRNNSFEEAIAHLPLSNDKLVSDDYNKIMSFINSQNYDLIIAGSDAIWNDAQTSKPNVFYLGKDINCDQVSFAASSFGMDYTKKDNAELNAIAEKISLFKFVGVRDKATEDYVQLLDLGVSAKHTCDPSIILDLEQKIFTTERIQKVIEQGGIDLSKPLFGVMGGEWLGKIARDIIGDEAQLIALYEPNKYANMYLEDLSPFEWAKVFSLFTMTFTHYFHGTLFSLKNGTPTMSVEWENDYSAKFDTKILDVLKRLGLEDYRFTKSVAENKPGLLKKHFDKVISDMDNEKLRIHSGLNREAQTYNQFVEAVEKLIRR